MKINDRNKSAVVVLCFAMLLSLVLTGCSKTESSTLENEIITEVPVDTISETDVAEEPEESSPEVISIESVSLDYTTAITLCGSYAEIEGSGALSDGCQVVISAAGTYQISGTLDDGRIVVDAQGEDIILILNEASISCSSSCPLYIYKSASTTIVLEENTVNTLSDGSNYDYSDGYSSQAENEPNACLYSKSDLMITGNGVLNVNAFFNNGITGKDTLQIVYASVNVSAANNGITGKDCVVLSGAAAAVDCSGNGISSSNDSDEALGYITLTDSTVSVDCLEDAIDAQTALSITNCTVDIFSSGSSSASAKGLKAGNILISSGAFNINTTDDAIHSNGDVSIFGGSLILSSGDDAIHGDDTVTVSGGDITISECYEGLEGSIINITGGNISVIASDDGLNAAGGADQSGFAGGFADSFSSTNSSINISGGSIYIDADGDGVDSNGSLNISGGELYISGPTNSGNGAIDYENSGTISGGIVVAAGSTGMAMNFGSTSTQGSMLVKLSGNAGDAITLEDSEGNVLVSYTAQKRFECVVVSCPELTVGETYTLSSGGSSTSITLSSLISGGSGMGGMMQWGGMGHGGGPGQGGGQPGQNGGQPGQSGGQPGGFGGPAPGNG